MQVRASRSSLSVLRLSLLRLNGQDGMFVAMTCSDLIGAALLAAAEQVEYRHDTRPFLLVKGLACQTKSNYGQVAAGLTQVLD